MPLSRSEPLHYTERLCPVCSELCLEQCWLLRGGWPVQHSTAGRYLAMGRNSEVGLHLWVLLCFNFLVSTVSWNRTPSLGLKKQRENCKVWCFGALSGSVEVKRQDRAVPGCYITKRVGWDERGLV